MSEKKVIDARGSFCPGPLMELIGWMKMAAIGDELELLSTDKGSVSDVPEWVKKVGHEFLGTHEESGVWHITVKKAK